MPRFPRFAVFVFLLCAGFASLRASFAPVVSLVPDTGVGMASDYAGLAPKWIQDQTALQVPEPGRNELSLVWTFWGHTRPDAATWPSGNVARVQLTLRAERAVTVRASALLRAGEWSAPADAATVEVKLVAGKPVAVSVPLPAAKPTAPVEALRVVLVADEDLPALTVTDWSVGEENAVALRVPSAKALLAGAPLTIEGDAAPNAAVAFQAVDETGRVVVTQNLKANARGRFEPKLDRARLPVGPLTLRAAAKDSAGRVSQAREVALHVYPPRDVVLPMVARQGRELLVNGKPWGFAGLNYTRFSLGFARQTDFHTAAEDLRRYGAWGVGVLRVPLHLGAIQPAKGVFPDHPSYAELMRAHDLDPDFFRLLDTFVAWSGHHGIRLVLEWHEIPNDPYRYFVGGEEKDRGTGKPGKGIAWLSDSTGGQRFDWGDAALVEAIADANRWLARRYKGNGNLLGFEVPYNEPHSPADSSEMAWRRVTVATLRPIIAEDPARLTFGMAPAWGHGNTLPSVTWQLPDELSGVAPHYYLGNGPVALRPDAKQRPEPWLARDVAATFDHSFAAVALPHSAAPWPVWNGESGEHGFESLFPDLKQAESAPWMIEAQLAQAYAAGMAGSLGWTLTGHETIYAPLLPVLEKNYRRFAPVFRAGPVDYSRAKVLFVQNPGAVPIDNGLNQACVPFARLALDLHLAPVHYMTDDQLLANGLVQISAGLEQVESVAAGLDYRAIVVDTRNLDQRALELLRSSKLPLLVVDDASKLDAERLAAFLGSAGLRVDRRTPAEYQLIPGRGHLLVYRRSGESTANTRVYPALEHAGAFRLVDEQGKTVFTGTAERLAADGLPLALAKWTTAIFRIEAAR